MRLRSHASNGEDLYRILSNYPKQLPTIPTAVDVSVSPEKPSNLYKTSLCGRGMERVYRSGHPWIGEEGQNWLNICGGPFLMMVNAFFIGEELRGKKYLFAASLRENGSYLNGNLGEKLFCQNPV